MPRHPSTPPADSLLKKRERDRRAQQNVRNKRAAHVCALEQRIATLESELKNAQETCQDLGREVKILRGRQGSLQHLVASWGGTDDTTRGVSPSCSTVNSCAAEVAGGGSLPSLPAVTHSHTQSERESHGGVSVMEKLRPAPLVAPVPPLPPLETATTPATTPDTSVFTPPRWNMLPAHIPERDVIITNCFSSWLHRPDLARACPESPQPLELLYGSKKNFLANTIYETIQQWPCRQVERLASGWLTYHLIKWMVQPTEECFARIPVFLRPTLEQLCHPHPYYVDFNPWPEVRANLVRHRGVYEDLDVVGMMSCCLRVRWPWNAPFLEPDDDNQFILKPEFYSTFTKLEGWGLTKEFLDKFPLIVQGLDPSVRYEIC